MKYASKYPGRLTRTTFREPVTVKGIGLHSGCEVILKAFPADAGTGLVFRASGEHEQKGDIEISPYNVVDTRQAVTLSNGDWTISTVEHFLCALAVVGITDAYFEINAEEIPILDGSAKPFYDAFMAAGIYDLGVALDPIVVNSPIWVLDGERYVIALPHDSFRVTYGISFNHPLLRGQTVDLELNSESCARELLNARTFGFFRDVEAMKERGLARGASLENAVVFTDDGFLNDELRYEDESVRHKVLDLIGDLYLMGRPIQAHIIASRAGHGLDVALAKNILAALSRDELAERREKAPFPVSVLTSYFAE